MRWISTFTGRRLYPLEPRAQDVDIRDIAHALALKTRFGGHGRVFYSIAEHSVRVSRILPDDLALWGLMHDAGEAYLADIPRPVKAQWPTFHQWEDRVLEAIAQRFQLCWPIPEQVMRADDILLATEARDLMPGALESWKLAEQPLAERVEPMTWEGAEQMFLRRFAELTDSKTQWHNEPPA
jgi:hypothetical protein